MEMKPVDFKEIPEDVLEEQSFSSRTLEKTNNLEDFKRRITKELSFNDLGDPENFEINDRQFQIIKDYLKNNAVEEVLINPTFSLAEFRWLNRKQYEELPKLVSDLDPALVIWILDLFYVENLISDIGCYCVALERYNEHEKYLKENEKCI